MDAIFTTIITKILESGPMGLALIAICGVVWFFHNQGVTERDKHNKQIETITTSCNEHHASVEDKLMTLVEKNTEAMTKSASAIDNCTAAITETGRTLHSCMNLVTELSVMFRGMSNNQKQ